MEILIWLGVILLLLGICILIGRYELNKIDDDFLKYKKEYYQKLCEIEEKKDVCIKTEEQKESDIIIKVQTDGPIKWYVAYCEKYGLAACHGIGQTQQEALQSFLNELDIFVCLLENKNNNN